MDEMDVDGELIGGGGYSMLLHSWPLIGVEM